MALDSLHNEPFFRSADAFTDVTRTDIWSYLRYGSYSKIKLGFVWYRNNEQIYVHMVLECFKVPKIVKSFKDSPS